MRTAFLLAFGANLVLDVILLILLPERVATHFGPGGAADSWESKEAAVLMMFAAQAGMLVIFLGIPAIEPWVPRSLVNLPNKDYWLRKENRPVLRAKLAAFNYEMGIAVFALLFAIGLLWLQANLSGPVRFNPAVFILLAVALLIYAIIRGMHFLNTFRLPGRTDRKTPANPS
ncbi:MAG TPA: DUF1648 domain-containing protein [Planctomycetota bacterium]|nr:DUF1648 domain-containing protein [Planctomycetota bacterium]